MTGWIGTATDIENLQARAGRARRARGRRSGEAREAAEAANRAKDEFLATLSHELRTPLNAMVGWAHMLRSRTLPPDKEQKALETIERNARAQAELIEDILDVSRIITGKLRIELQPVDRAVDRRRRRRRRAARGGGEGDHARSPHRRAARRTSPATPPACSRRSGTCCRTRSSSRPRAAASSWTSRPTDEARGRRGARHRLRHRARIQAVRVRSLPPARQQQPAHARRAGARPGHRPPRRRAARRHASPCDSAGDRPGRDVHACGCRCGAGERGADRGRARDARQAGAMRPSTTSWST